MTVMIELAEPEKTSMTELSVMHMESLKEREGIPSSLKTIIETFLLAINDWPYPVATFDEYALHVEDFINGLTIKERIEECLKSIDFTKYAWEAESLSHIVSVFQFQEPKLSLKEAIENLKQEIGFLKLS